MTWLKNLFSGGFIGLATTLGEAFNRAMAALEREQDRQAGRNENELIHRNKQDEVRKNANEVYDGANRGRFVRVRNDDKGQS